MAIRMFVSQNLIFILIYLIIIPALALLTFFEILPVAGLAAAVIVLALLENFGELANRWETAKHRSRVRRRTKQLNSELQEAQEVLEEDFLDLNEYGGDNLAEYVENAISPDHREYLSPLLVYLLETSSFDFESKEQRTLEEILRRDLHGYSLAEPSDNDVFRSWLIYQILCKDDVTSITDDPSDTDFMDTDCFRNRFVRKYVHKTEVIQELKTEQNELEEYRSTLAKLYENGRLNEFGLHQLVTDIDEYTSLALTDQTHYLILSNEIQYDESFKEIITDAVERDGHEIYSGSLNVSGGLYSLSLAVCDDDYSTREFFTKYVEPALNQTENDGWLSVHRSIMDGESIFREQYNTKEPSKNAKQGMKSRNVLITGERSTTINLKQELIESYLTTDELLSVLPLNLFLPDLPSEKKEKLVEHNDEIKEKFGVTQLTDWAHPNHTPDEIGRFLQQNYFPTDSEQDWVNNAEAIIERAKEVSEALS